VLQLFLESKVFNQTGLHNLYYSGSFKEAEQRHLQNILNHVTDSPPDFVLATGEDWSVKGYEDILAGKFQTFDMLQQLLISIKASGIPVHIGAFGIRDNSGLEQGPVSRKGISEFPRL
jgi:hypothetical protein